MIENHTISHVDVNLANLPKNLREKYSKHHRNTDLYFDRYEEYEDLLTYFPKTQQSIKALKVFLLRRCGFDELIDHDMEVYKNVEQKNTIDDKRKSVFLVTQQIKDSLKEQWNELIEKEEDLQKSLKTYRKFLRYSQEKRERLLDDVREYRKTRRSRQRGIDFLSQKNPRLKEIIKQMQQHIERMAIYEDFLDTALKCHGSEFEKVEEIMRHFQTIHEKKSSLAEEFGVASHFVHGWISKMIHLNKAADSEIHSLHMEVQKLQRRYEEATQKTEKMHVYHMLIVEKLRQRSQELIICKESIYSLYSVMQERLPQKNPRRKDDFVGQLKYMSRILKNLGSIRRQKMWNNSKKIGKMNHSLR